MRKKKILSIICVISMMISSHNINSYATGNTSEPTTEIFVSDVADKYTEITVDGLIYNVFSDHAEIVNINYNETPQNIVIPEIVGGKPVTKIRKSYLFNEQVISVSFPDTIIDFPYGCMADCENLESVKLPAHIKKLPINTFFRCKKIKSIELPDELEEIGSGSFWLCENLEKITIPENVSKIGIMAFRECASLKEVTILNPKCDLQDNWTLICNTYDENTQIGEYNGIIRGYNNSTAQEYAENFGYKFELINSTLSPNATKSGDTAAALEDMVIIIPARSFPFPGEELTFNILAYSLPSDIISNIEFDFNFDSPYIIPQKSFFVVSKEDGRYIYTLRVRLKVSEYAKGGEEFYSGKYTIKKVVDINGNDITDKISYIEGTTGFYVEEVSIPTYSGLTTTTTTKPTTTSTTSTATTTSATTYTTSTTTAKPTTTSTTSTTTSTTTKPTTTSTTTSTTTEPSTTTTEPIVSSKYKLGDVTGDSIIDGRDATDVLTDYAKTSTGQESKYTEEQKKAADVNSDNIIDGRDATAILTYYAKTSVGGTMTLEEYMESIK